MASYRVPVLQDFSWQPPVSDKDLTAAPGSPTKGDRYIVGGSATGDWATHDGSIAWYDGAAWQFDAPSDGWQVYVVDEACNYRFDGAAWDKESITQLESATKANSGNIAGNLAEINSVSGSMSATVVAAGTNSAAITANSTAIDAVSSQASHALSTADIAESAQMVNEADIATVASTLLVAQSTAQDVSDTASHAMSTAKAASALAKTNSAAIVSHTTDLNNISDAASQAKSASKVNSASIVANDAEIDQHVSDISALVATKIPLAQKAAANGVATLDAGGKVPVSQLPATVLGSLQYIGAWDATGTYPAAPETGDYHIVDTAGNGSGNQHEVGDWIVYNGATWDAIDNTDKVDSVNGYVGTVSLGYSDVGAASVSQATADSQSVVAMYVEINAVSQAAIAADSATVANWAAIQTNSGLVTTISGEISAAKSATVANNAAIVSNDTAIDTNASAASAALAHADDAISAALVNSTELLAVSAAAILAESATVANGGIIASNSTAIAANSQAASALLVDKQDVGEYVAEYGAVLFAV